jgi:hypothetical protein
LQWYIRRLVANQYLYFQITLSCFGNREGRFWLSKIILIFWEKVCKKYLCIYSLLNRICRFLCRIFEGAFYVSVRYSNWLECPEFDIHWYNQNFIFCWPRILLWFLVNDQLDAQFFSMCLFQLSTCFEQPRAHHQENTLHQYSLWCMSFCVGDRFVCSSESYFTTCTRYTHFHSNWKYCCFFVAKCSIIIFVFFALYASFLANLEYCCCYS